VPASYRQWLLSMSKQTRICRYLVSQRAHSHPRATSPLPNVVVWSVHAMLDFDEWSRFRDVCRLWNRVSHLRLPHDYTFTLPMPSAPLYACDPNEDDGPIVPASYVLAAEWTAKAMWPRRPPARVVLADVRFLAAGSIFPSVTTLELGCTGQPLPQKARFGFGARHWAAALLDALSDSMPSVRVVHLMNSCPCIRAERVALSSGWQSVSVSSSEPRAGSET